MLILLVVCYWLVHFVWKMKKNPDITCIPLLTATGDLLGVAFLFGAFYLVYLTGNTSVSTPIQKESTLVFNGTLESLTTTISKVSTT